VDGKNIRKKEIKDRVALVLCAVMIILCSAGLLLCYAKERTKRIYNEILDETPSVLPGENVSAAVFRFTVELSDVKHRRYDLIICDISFEGGDLTFGDMNEGQWEYSTDGTMWLPLILSKGECLLKADVSAGKKILLIRAADDLDVKAAGSSLNFQLKLKEKPGKVNSRILIGIAVGSMLILSAYLTAENNKRRKERCILQSS